MKFKQIPHVSELLATLVRSDGEDQNIPDILQDIVKTVQTYVSADLCILYAKNPITGNSLAPLFSTQASPDAQLLNTAWPMFSESSIQKAFRNGLYIIDSTQDIDPQDREALRQLHAHIVVVLPLSTQRPQRQLGMLYLIYQQEQALSETDRNFLQTTATHISAFLKGIWMQYRYREVARIGQEINHELSDIKLLFEKLKSRIGTILDANHALLLAIYQPQAKTLEVYQAQQGNSIYYPAYEFAGASRYVIESKKHLFIRHMSKEASNFDFQIENLEGTRPEESFIYVPLILRGDPVGAISIQHPEPDAYTEEDRFILELLANHIALAVRNARLFNNLRLLSETSQILTQQFEASNALQAIVEVIKKATRADVIVLYPYNRTTKSFVSPPSIAGMLRDPASQHTARPSRTDDIALLMLSQPAAIFARESFQLYTQLRGNIPLVERKRFYEREQLCSTAAIPLYVEEKAVGVLFINFRQPQLFDATQRLLIDGLAHAAAIAIKNARTFEQLNERRIHELEALQKIDSALNTPEPDLQSVLTTILKIGHKEVDADYSSILLYNAQEQMLTCGASTGTHAMARVLENYSFPVSQTGIISWVIQHKKIARVDNVHQDLPWQTMYRDTIEGTVSELDVPMLDDGAVIGLLNFESARESAFGEEDAQFLKTLAGQAILAIKKAQAYEREKRFATRFRLLYEAGKELGKLTEPEDIQQAYEITLRLAQELSQSPVVIRRYNEASQELILAYTTWHRYSPPSHVLKLNQGFNGKVARERRTIVIDDVDRYPADEFPRPVDPTIHSLLITPIEFQERYYGNLELSHEAIDHFRDKDQEFFEGLAQQLASTLYRLEITQKRQEAEIMSLVGQSTFEITHRLKEDLGLVGHKTRQITSELERLQVNHSFFSERLEYIADAVANVLRLGDNLRNELKTGLESEQSTTLPPRVLLEEALHSVTLPRTIDVHFEIEPGLPQVRVRQQLIVDTLRNLITNAKEAMPEGGTLTLCASTSGRSIAIEIKDTGVGIPKEKHLKIFALFYSTKQRDSGFGLWSALVNARRHGGNLKVSSEEGKGATFTLLLPGAEGYTS